MSKNDALDRVLQKITAPADRLNLMEVCRCRQQAEGLGDREWAEALNREIRGTFSHTPPQEMADAYSPDYGKILRETASKLGVKKMPSSLTDGDIEEWELKLAARALGLIKKVACAAKGASVWEEAEREAATGVEAVAAEGRLRPEERDLLRRAAASGGILTAFSEGRLPGMALYAGYLAGSRWLAGGRGQYDFDLGALKGLVFGRGLSFGEKLELGKLVGQLSDSGLRQTIGAVLFIAVMRQKQKREKGC